MMKALAEHEEHELRTEYEVLWTQVSTFLECQLRNCIYAIDLELHRCAIHCDARNNTITSESKL